MSEAIEITSIGPSITVEVLTWRGLVTYYVLFFSHLDSQNRSRGDSTSRRRSAAANRAPRRNQRLYHDDGTRETVESPSDEFSTTDGTLCVAEKFRPPYRCAVYRDFQFFLPLDTLRFRDCGTWHFKYQLVIRSTEPHWKVFAHSPWRHFEYGWGCARGFREIRAGHKHQPRRRTRHDDRFWVTPEGSCIRARSSRIG
jgi:hypothetical protein